METKDSAGIIARLEAASGPDREIDALLHQILWPDLLDASAEKDGWLIGGDHALPTLSARYTSSIDAALSLVPEGMNGSIAFGTHAGAILWKGSPQNHQGDSRAATPAIALCIAALRSRAQGE